jgi:hypothetical protein
MCSAPSSCPVEESKFGDDVRIALLGADVSTEPDGMFVLYESLQSGKIRKIAGKNGGVTELEGIPDMVLEVVGDLSVVKDTVDLPALYCLAGVAEFWRVDARRDECRFEVLIRRNDRFAAAIEADGWQKSSIFNKWFRLERTYDPLGNPLFELQVKD